MSIPYINKIIFNLYEWKAGEIQLPAEILEEAKSFRLLYWISVKERFICRTHERIEEKQLETILAGFDSWNIASSYTWEILLQWFQVMPSLKDLDLIETFARGIAAHLNYFFVSVTSVYHQDQMPIPVIQIQIISEQTTSSRTCTTVSPAPATNEDHLMDFGDWIMKEIMVLNTNIPRGFDKVVAPVTIIKALNEKDQSELCGLCSERFRKAEPVRILRCLHMYHAMCIILWFKRPSSSPFCPTCKSTCPKCRSTARVQIPSLVQRKLSIRSLNFLIRRIF